MNLTELTERQRRFDEAHASRFEWSDAASPENRQPLVYVTLALAGEVGELANVVKKLERGDYTYEEAVVLLKDEAADVFIYLLKLAYQTGIDLERAFLDKLASNAARFSNLEK